jgi:hypothetical protein
MDDTPCLTDDTFCECDACNGDNPDGEHEAFIVGYEYLLFFWEREENHQPVNPFVEDSAVWRGYEEAFQDLYCK